MMLLHLIKKILKYIKTEIFFRFPLSYIYVLSYAVFYYAVPYEIPDTSDFGNGKEIACTIYIKLLIFVKIYE